MKLFIQKFLKSMFFSAQNKKNGLKLFFASYLQIVLLLSLNGCNYVIEGSNPVLPNEARTIAVLPIQNHTFVAGLETDLSEQLNTLLNSNSSIKIVPAGISDIQLSVTLLNYKTNSSGLSKEDVTSGVKAIIQGEVILLDRRTKKNVWIISMLEVKLTESLENEMENVSNISLSGSTREIIKLFAKKIYARIFTTF